MIMRIKGTAKAASGRRGYPVFWLSSGKEPIALPINQRSNNGNLLFGVYSWFFRVNPNAAFEARLTKLFTRAEVLIKHNCTWFNINWLNNISGANSTKITASNVDQAITNYWGQIYEEYIVPQHFQTMEESFSIPRQVITRSYVKQTFMAKGYKS